MEIKTDRWGNEEDSTSNQNKRDVKTNENSILYKVVKNIIVKNENTGIFYGLIIILPEDIDYKEKYHL